MTPSDLYRQLLADAAECARRAREQEIPPDHRDAEFVTMAVKCNAAAALSLTQAAMTVFRAVNDTKTGRTGR